MEKAEFKSVYIENLQATDIGKSESALKQYSDGNSGEWDLEIPNRRLKAGGYIYRKADRDNKK